MELNWSIKRFQELSTDELHDLLDLRVRVFVVEQNCPYPELDGKDRQSTHLIGREEGGDIVAYSRIVDPGLSYTEPSIGRVATKLSYRGKGLGDQLMQQSMLAIKERFGQVGVRISAQEYLRGFYLKHGFRAASDIYLEDDIPHLEMIYEPGTELPAEEDPVKQRRQFYGILWENFDAAKNEMLEFVDDWSLEALQFSPSENAWNALQVIDHIVTSEKGTISYMLKKTQAEPHELPYLDKGDRDKAFKLMRRLNSEERYEAPAALAPPEAKKEMILVLREWDEIRDRYRHFLGTLSAEYYGKFIFRHPFTGPMSVEESLGFLIGHIHHHMHQLRRIKSSIEAQQ